MDAKGPTVTQEMGYMQPFHAEVIVLHTPKGNFTPIRPLCEMLGLPTRTWIGVLCNRYKHGGVERWIYQTTDGKCTRGQCLKQELVTRLLLFLDPKYLYGQRREQLIELQHAFEDLANQKYSQRQANHEELRRMVFKELQTCEKSLAQLDATEQRMQAVLLRLPNRYGNPETLVSEMHALYIEGRTCFGSQAAELRKILAEITNQPVIDGMVIDDQGEVVETKARPVLPIVPELRSLERCNQQIKQWMARLDAWFDAHHLSGNKDDFSTM